MSDYSSDREAMEDWDFDDDMIQGDQDAKIKGEYLADFEESDYKDMAEMDEYNMDELDHDEYSEMSLGAKRKADEEMNRRENKGKPIGGKGRWEVFEES